MAVCNIFNNLIENTNNFLLFSQYTEDLGKMTTAPALYRVVPSKFLALNINTENIAELLMKKYENGCAYIRSNYTPDIFSFVNIAKNLLWNMLFSENILTTEVQDDTPASYIPQIKYCGTIDIQSYEQDSGMGYSEIYCWIPNDAMETHYECSKIGDSQEIICNDQWLSGFTASDQEKTTIDLSIDNEIIYLPDRQYVMSFENEQSDQGLNSVVIKSNYFEFNSILILYDIEYINSDGIIGKLYTDIPLGLWINENSELIKKFVSNEDIYGQGTSYGLKILSRFTPTPNNDTIKNVDIKIENNENLADYSRVMSGFADINTQISSLLKTLYDYYQTPKELLAIFKNSRVNVPYIKYINEIPYWFVNGRCLNVRADGK